MYVKAVYVTELTVSKFISIDLFTIILSVTQTSILF